MTQEHTTKEMGLLKVAANHKLVAMQLHNALGKAESVIVRLARVSADPETIVWNYVESRHQWWWGDSARLGVFTSIVEWETKRGKTALAHVTENGRFMRWADKDGEFSKPYAYHGNFHIQRARFQFVMNDCAETLADFFQPVIRMPVRILKRPVVCAQ